MSTSTTEIAWTDRTWGPTRGCSRVSAGCEACYAERQAYRFSTKPGSPYEGLVRLGKKGPVWTGKVRLVASALAEPLSWRKPARVFVDSMSDLFHEGLSNEDIAAVFGVMAAAQQHTFQLLTKRASRMREWFEWAARDGETLRAKYRNERASVLINERLVARSLKYVDVPTDYAVEWPLPNVWIGVSAEDQQRADERVPELLGTPAVVRFVSYEPALGPIDFTHIKNAEMASPSGSAWVDALRGYINGSPFRTEKTLDWIIVGGESGPRARPFDVAWARSVVEQCTAANVARFVKQLGARPYDTTHLEPGCGFGPDDAIERSRLRLEDRKGGDMLEWPLDLRVRQFPKAVAL